MKEEVVGKYLNERIKFLVETAIEFEGFIGRSHTKLQEEQIEVKQMKKDNPELKAADVKDRILGLSTGFYKMNMVEQNLKNTACSISELNTVAKTLGFEIVLEGKNKEAFDLMTAQDKDMFLVENGEVVPVDKDLYTQIEQGLIDRASEEETLNANFSHI